MLLCASLVMLMTQAGLFLWRTRRRKNVLAIRCRARLDGLDHSLVVGRGSRSVFPAITRAAPTFWNHRQPNWKPACAALPFPLRAERYNPMLVFCVYQMMFAIITPPNNGRIHQPDHFQ